jgi:hypothetical protein
MEINYDFNVFDALTVQAIYFCCILIIAARIANRENLAFWLGIPLLLTAIPLIFLLFQGAMLDQPLMYTTVILLMLVWLAVKLVLDYLFKVDFRRNAWGLILYTFLFLIATGGMIYVAAQAGVFWMILSISFYAIMVVLVFIYLFRQIAESE